ncbi:hypothetical protein SEA_FORZA_89 [Gordonia phage Forza]|uniref:Major tail protein n=1 Tax=Gordonia phage Forza TaxID=2571247 RepID=A0A650FAZ4_9CAUD|nr:major tail protein [Gordonia phage Forza]QEM41556.1 hypothetical protein SEA_BOOPY_89 [Gordonia phage Boopy]QGT55082.1 hypothetical protein SEA_FORZA_89 [Gordonia phage Forza]UXE04230.1 major tail protein [Gordonia phage BlueNGold]WBF03870.1 hypothetical protein SEA_MAREELIH_87 [Gordonia phage Mareelih]
MTDHASSVQGVALVVSRLTPTGAVATGPKSAYAVSTFMKFGFTPEYTEGDEVEEKAADGTVCVYFKSPDVLKRVTFSLTICDPSPELTEILAGGSLLTDGSETVGYAAPETGTNATPNGVGFEVWSRAVVKGKQAAAGPFWRWVFPYANMRFTGERAMENGMMANEFEGWGVGNALYDDGPLGTWEHGTEVPFKYARADTAPVGINDYLAVSGS